MSQGGYNGTGTGGGSTTDLHAARFIVSAGGTTDGANYTTIASAIAAAVTAGGQQTVFIQPGSYTENLTLPVNIKLEAFGAKLINNVTINGKLTASYAGVSSLTGITLNNSGDYVVDITGSTFTTINFTDCRIGGSGVVELLHCGSNNGSMLFNNCSLTGFSTQAIFNFTGGSLTADSTTFGGGATDPASTISGNGRLNLTYCFIAAQIITSGTGIHTIGYCRFAAPFTHNSAGSSVVEFCKFGTASLSAISIGTGATLDVIECSVSSTNTNAITGAGTIRFGQIDFYGTSASNVINTTTQTPIVSQLGELKLKSGLAYRVLCGGTTDGGVTQNVASAGNAGEVLTSNGAAALPTWQSGGGGSGVGFSACVSTAVANVTGNGTPYTVIFNTELFDNGGNNYDPTTGVFTAPSAGKYIIPVQVTIMGITIDHTNAFLNIVTSGGQTTQICAAVNPFAVQSGGYYSIQGTAIIALAAAETFTITITVLGTTQVVGVYGSGSTVLQSVLSGARLF